MLRNRDFNLNQFFQDILPDHIFPQAEGKMMKIDIKEYKEYFIFNVEVPGVKREDIDIGVTDDVLSISVKKQEEIDEEEDVKMIRNERRFGEFQRSFTVPYVDTDHIRASYENGILRLLLPKVTEETISKRTIDVK